MNTERVNVLIEKINSLRNQISKENLDIIDIDLMMDYSRVLYADLLDLRQKIMFNLESQKSQIDIQISSDNHHKNIESKDSITLETPISFQETQDEIIEIEGSGEQGIQSNNQIIDYIKDIPTSTHPIEKIIDNNTPKSKDIRHYITINDRFLFMSDLFNNDKFDYESALDIMNNLPTYEDASRWIQDNYFETMIWDKENSVTQAFLNAVKSRY